MGIAPSSRNAFSAAAAWAPVATHPATSSAPAIPSPMHVVVAPLRPSHGRRAFDIVVARRFRFRINSPRAATFGETSPDALGKRDDRTVSSPGATRARESARSHRRRARAGAEDAGNAAKPAFENAPSPSFAPTTFRARSRFARPSPRSAVSANHDATPLLSPLTDRFVRRSDVPCTANHAIAHNTSTSSSSSSGFPNAARTVGAGSSTFPSCASRSSDGFPRVRRRRTIDGDAGHASCRRVLFASSCRASRGRARDERATTPS